jgi:cell division transport system permease protein
MISFLRHVILRTLRNMRKNLFLNLSTIGIITISVLIFSTFSLIAFNLASFLALWEDRIEVIAYLKRQTSLKEMESLLTNTRTIEGVEAVKYISPFDAMVFMERKLSDQKNLLEGIKAAIFPPSFEIQLKKEYRNSTKIKEVVSRLKQLPQVEEIQYGQEWVETFSAIVHLLRLAQWILGGVLLVAMVFIISNTLQLAISSRREEIEVMHLVGASPAFIQVPFYLEGMIQSLFGAGSAILLLFLLHKLFLFYIASLMPEWLSRIPILFLPPDAILRILVGGIVLGFFGSFIASMRFLK